MYLFKSNSYEQYLNKLPPPIKGKIIENVKQLKNPFLASTLIIKPLKNHEGTYSWDIEKDYFIALLLDGLIWMLLFVGKIGEDTDQY